MKFEFSVKFDLSNLFASEYHIGRGDKHMGSDDYITNLAEEIKARDQKRDDDFKRIQHENERKLQEATVTFGKLKEWLKQATSKLNFELQRDFIVFQFDKFGKPEGRLVGEGTNNYLDLKIKDKGIIAYDSPLASLGSPVQRSGGFYPEITPDDNVRFRHGDTIVTIEDMGQKLISLVK